MNMRPQISDKALRLMCSERLEQIEEWNNKKHDPVYLIQAAEEAILIASSIASPTDHDIDCKGDLFLYMSISQSRVDNTIACINYVQMAIRTYSEVKEVSDDNFYNKLYARRFLAEMQAKQGTEGQLLALHTLSEAIDDFKKITVPDDYAYLEAACVHMQLSELNCVSAKNKIVSCREEINLYQQIKDKNDVHYESIAQACSKLGTLYTQEYPKKYEEAIAIEFQGVEAAQLIKSESDKKYRLLSDAYYNLNISIRNSTAAADLDYDLILDLLQKSLQAFNSVVNKRDRDYRFAAKTCCDIAFYTYKKDIFAVSLPYIRMSLMFLAKVNKITKNHLLLMRQTAELGMEICTPTEPTYQTMIYIKDLLTLRYDRTVNDFIAYVIYILQRAQWPEAFAVSELLVNLITVLLKAADTGAFDGHNLLKFLLPDKVTRKHFQHLLDELMKQELVKLSQQVEHSVPLITQMAKKIKDLESEVEYLKEEVSKRDRQSEVDLPDLRVSKKLGLFADTSIAIAPVDQASALAAKRSHQ